MNYIANIVLENKYTVSSKLDEDHTRLIKKIMEQKVPWDDDKTRSQNVTKLVFGILYKRLHDLILTLTVCQTLESHYFSNKTEIDYRYLIESVVFPALKPLNLEATLNIRKYVEWGLSAIGTILNFNGFKADMVLTGETFVLKNGLKIKDVKLEIYYPSFNLTEKK